MYQYWLVVCLIKVNFVASKKDWVKFNDLFHVQDDKNHAFMPILRCRRKIVAICFLETFTVYSCSHNNNIIHWGNVTYLTTINMFETCSVDLILHIPAINHMTRIKIESLARMFLYLWQENLSNILRFNVISIFIQRTWNNCPVCFASISHLALWLMRGLSVSFTTEISCTCTVVQI